MAPNLYDLEAAIIRWAWEQFSITRDKSQKHLQMKDLDFNINWTRVRFHSETAEYTDKQMLEVPNSQVVFKSTFENCTDQMQEHQFQTDRSTTSSCSTTVTHGFTKGINLELNLSTPYEVLSATAGFSREISMEKAEDDTHQKTVNWSINSTIKVPPHHVTTAELVVKEQQFSARFKMTAKISGNVVVVVTNRRDNNSFVECIQNNICEVMRDMIVETEGAPFQIQGNTIIWEITGRCQFRYGIEQHVHLEEKALPQAGS